MKNKTPVSIIRCDNSGENQVLRTHTTEAGFSIQYEYTAPATPQHNGRVERKFSVLYNYMRSMLNYAQVPEHIRTALWAEAASHATDILNAICTATNPVPPYKQMYGINPPYFQSLRTFGEVCVLQNPAKIKSKVFNKGYLGLYVGRSADHSNETNKFFNLQSHKVILSQNAQFMSCMYNEYFANTPTNNNRYLPLSDTEDDDDANNNILQSSHPTSAVNIPTLINSPTTSPVDDDQLPLLTPDSQDHHNLTFHPLTPRETTTTSIPTTSSRLNREL
jgi:hypothetical protein